MTATKAGKLRELLLRPTDIASAAVFRFCFGGLLLFSVLRFMAKGWIQEFYLEPTFFFTYYGFSWIKPWPEWGMYLHFAVMAAAALGIALGFYYRASALLFFLTFTYVELLDKTNYLNHYYFVSLLTFVMLFLPLNRAASIDAWRKPGLRRSTLPAWVLWALRLQVGLVYFFGGIAKLKSDWILQAQPLRIWLAARPEFPLLGGYFHEPWIAHAMSMAGLFFDLTVPFWLLWKKSRPFAYAAVVVFHVMTVKLFYIGMFPWIMIVAAMVFFSPSWPRRWLPESWGLFSENHTGASLKPARTGSLQKVGFALCGVYFLLQFLIPLRHWLYPGPVTWTEEGYRFSWNVMLMEKNGSVEFQVRNPLTGQTWQVRPREYLKPQQAKMMSTQPDMILAFAHHLADVYRAKGNADIEVRVDAFASLNGRPSQRLIDPEVDLSRVEESFLPKPWILPFQEKASRQ
jgi:vitamin K-dependent gamma-carboxylase